MGTALVNLFACIARDLVILLVSIFASFAMSGVIYLVPKFVMLEKNGVIPPIRHIATSTTFTGTTLLCIIVDLARVLAMVMRNVR